MKNPFRVGVALIVIGFVGLLVLGAMGWGGPGGRWGHGPIVRSLVEAHGGRVTVTSQQGEGSTFSVVLPI